MTNTPLSMVLWLVEEGKITEKDLQKILEKIKSRDNKLEELTYEQKRINYWKEKIRR